jgi:hypothetical protein
VIHQPFKTDNLTEIIPFHSLYFQPMRRIIIQLLILSMIVFIMSSKVIQASNEPDKNQELPMDYSRLLEFIETANIESPLFAFDAFEKELDAAVHRSNLEYLKDHPDLLYKIRHELNTEELQWKLENFKRRLLFVPETREEYASLFKSYCTDVIDYVLAKTQLQNPFAGITNLTSEIPQVSGTDEGITAFLVHNLAEEFVYTYGFYNRQQKKVVIELDQKSFIGEVGSYSSILSQTGDGTFVFAKNKYTIWQNNAKNPYTALMVPVEETLHITLRDYTEAAIREKIMSQPASMRKTAEVSRIVEEWIAVEEAITGGLVYGLLPEFLSNSITTFQPDWIASDLTAKSAMKRYRYLKKGIQVVEKLGVQESIHIYREDPQAFRDLLI